MPPVPLDKMVAMVQFEMIGRPDGKVPAKTLWLTGYERSDLGPTLARPRRAAGPGSASRA